MNFRILIILFAFTIELGLLSFWSKPVAEGGGFWNPLFLFLVSAFIGWYTIWSGTHQSGSNWIDRKIDATGWKLSRRINFPAWPMWVYRYKPYFQKLIQHPLTLLLIALWGLSGILPKLIAKAETYTISVSNSDIIPQIQVLVERFMMGEFPYQPINDFGYPLFSPYMPMHWGPFMLPAKLGFDERWLAFGVFIVGIAFFIGEVSKSRIHPLIKIGLAFLPALVFRLYIDHGSLIFSHTVELLIAGYYLIFSSSLLRDRPVVQAVGLSLCLLSRYALIIWVPVYLWTLYLSKDKRTAFKTGGIAFGVALLLYIIPFFLKDPGIISQGLAHHNQVTVHNWTFEPWFDADGRPGILFRGVGLAGYMYEFGPGTVLERLSYMKWTQLIACLALEITLAIWIWRKRYQVDRRMFLLGSLKLSLAFFYGLLPLPVLYYFFVPLCVSLPLLIVYIDRTVPLDQRYP